MMVSGNSYENNAKLMRTTICLYTNNIHNLPVYKQHISRNILLHTLLVYFRKSQVKFYMITMYLSYTSITCFEVCRKRPVTVSVRICF